MSAGTNPMQQTIETYNRGAKHFSEKFEKIGARVDDIALAFSFANKKNPRVVELGCGDGRDAAVITTRTNDYLGIDASSGMIALAKQRVPAAHFVVGDMTTCEMPSEIDILFAFASFLHCDRDTVIQILQRIHFSLSSDGIVCIAVKLGTYRNEIVEGAWGPRSFYYYEISDFHNMIGSNYKIVDTHTTTTLGVDWLRVILQKQST